MKKTILFIFTLLTGFATAQTDNRVVVNDVEIPQGGSGTIDIVLENTKVVKSMQVDVTLPAGFSFVENTSGSPKGTKNNDRLSENYTIASSYPDTSDKQTARFILSAFASVSISGNSGTVFSVNITADASLEQGTTHTGGKLTQVTLSDDNEIILPDVDFSIKIVDPTRIVLDETSTTKPDNATSVNVRVKRTINANEWSTICLPFDMTEAQVKTAFGDDVKIANFMGTETEFDITVMQ
ncbi:MAG: hypothetical protein IJT98_06105 [Prevotella sp.]|nr:hypothetical protein [Prevotella sp.]